MIKIKNLNKSYVRGKEIIPNLDLEFDQKGLTMIVGKSGCGKTTLLNIIGAMDLEYNGDVEVDGKNLHEMSYKEIVDYRNFETAFVFQKNSLFEFLTVKENLELCLDIQNNKSDISEALKKVGLIGFENKKVKALSGGEKQRVAIARALIKRCKIVFADEPTSALDTKNAHKIFQLFKELSKDKLVIVVTHDVKKSELYADRLIRLIDGAVIEDSYLNSQTKESLNSNVVQHEIIKESKKFPIKSMFKHQLKKGLVINLFIMLLLFLALVVINLALEQKPIKDEYDSFSSSSQTEFNTERAMKTHVENNINLYNVVKSNSVKDPYEYIKKATIPDKNLNNVDVAIVEDVLSEYDTDSYYYNNDFNSQIIIENLSQTPMFSTRITGNVYYWSLTRPTIYNYYEYDSTIDYDLMYGSSDINDEEILLTDTIAYAYITTNGYENLSDLVGEKIVIGDIYDSVDSSTIVRDFSYDSGRDDIYHLYEKKEYTVKGIIDTKQLGFFTYNTDTAKFELLSSFITQNNNNTDNSFMNRSQTTPYGYVVLSDELLGVKNQKTHYGTYAIDSLMFHNNLDEAISIDNISLSTFHGQYNFTNQNYISSNRPLAGFEDSLQIDYQNRLYVINTDAQNLVDNEIILSTSFASSLFDGISFRSTNINNAFNAVKDLEITLSFMQNGKIVDETFVIKGLSKDNYSSFYISDEMYGNIISSLQENSQEMTISLEGYSYQKRMTIMEQLFSKGYNLVPVNSMPGAYLEFVEGQGEMLASVNFEGLATLYPDYSLERIGERYYFISGGMNFGYVDDFDNPTYVYMASGLLKQISLDSSYYETDGNISVYYLYSEYYYTNDSELGNYILEIIGSMYIFLLAMAVILSLGFVFLKEQREGDNTMRLSMLGVRPKDIYVMQFITYFAISVIVAIFSIVTTWILVNVLNGMSAYHLVEGMYDVTINRVRIMFTSTTFITTIGISMLVFVINMFGAIIITKQNRK